MHLQFLQLDQCQSTEWDDFVIANGGHFMQSHAWGAFKKAQGWESVCLVAAENGSIKGGLLVISKKIPFIGKRIFYAPRGPIADDPEVFSFLIQNVRQYLNGHDAIFLRCDPYHPAEKETERFVQNGFIKLEKVWSYWNAPKLVLWLNLEEGIDCLFNKLDSQMRNKIRYPYKKGVIYRIGTRDDLSQFYELMSQTAQKKSIGMHGFEFYEQLYDMLHETDNLELFIGMHEGVVITVGMSVIFGKRAWLMYAASDDKYFKLKANRALQWEMIKWACDRNCECYDFRGTATNDPPAPEDPGYGVYLYKKSFGPDFIRLTGYYDLVINRALYSAFVFTENKLLPLGIKALNKVRRNRPDADIH